MTRRRFFALFAIPFLPSLPALGSAEAITLGNSLLPLIAPAESGMVTICIQGNFIGNQEFMDAVVLPAIRDAVENRDFIIRGES